MKLKRIFVRASIALVGMTTWLLPDRANATITCEADLPDGSGTVMWNCPSSQQCYWIVVCYSDDCYDFSMWIGCI